MMLTNVFRGVVVDLRDEGENRDVPLFNGSELVITQVLLTWLLTWTINGNFKEKFIASAIWWTVVFFCECFLSFVKETLLFGYIYLVTVLLCFYMGKC